MKKFGFILCLLGLGMQAHALSTVPSGPIQYLNNGVATPVTNSAGLPIAGSITATNPSVSATGAAVPANGTYIAASSAGNLTGLLLGQQTMANSLACVLPSNQSAIPVSESGTWTVQPGNTANTTPWLLTVSQGGNSATVSAGGALKVDGSAVTQPISAASLPLPTGASTAAKQPALGTAGTPSADVITVQGAASMTPLKVDGSAVTQPVSGTVVANIGTSGALALDASVTGLEVSQGSTTAGQKGHLALGAVTTAAPSYTTAQTSPFSLTLAGGLRVDGSAVTQPVSGTVTAKLNDGAGTSVTVGQKTMAASLPVALASDQSAIPTKAPVNANGSGSAAAATVSTVITLTAPSNAIGFVLQNLDTSTANVRWAIGRTATTTLGQQLQPGRDTGFVLGGANVSLVAESGTQNYDIQWVSQ